LIETITMLHSRLTLAIAVFAVAAPISRAADDATPRAVQEEVWALPVTLPILAYVVRPVGTGPFPLVIMNHGVSLNARERAFFPLVEFRDAVMWFARRGNIVVAPTGTGYGAAALDIPEKVLYGPFFRDRQLRESEFQERGSRGCTVR
jgi:hypothetical protein